jgi:hypothetical protein
MFGGAASAIAALQPVRAFSRTRGAPAESGPDRYNHNGDMSAFSPGRRKNITPCTANGPPDAGRLENIIVAEGR